VVKKLIFIAFILFNFNVISLSAINSVYFGGLANGTGFTEDQVDIVENLIINDLVESSFFSLKSINIETDTDDNDLILKGSIGFLDEKQISIKLWLIDIRSNQIILARELSTNEESFFVQLDQFSTEFISIVYEFLYGATEENIIKLVQMRQYEHANKLLNYYREKKGNPNLLSGLEVDINNGYADKLKVEIEEKIKQNQLIETDQELLQYILYSSNEDIEFLDSIRIYQLNYMQSLKKSLSKEIRKHLRFNNPEIALFLYNNFISQYGTDIYPGELSEMKVNIDEQLKQVGLEDAQANIRRENFVESEFLIETSINTIEDPSDSDINESLVLWETKKGSKELIDLAEIEVENQWTAGFRNKHDINLSLDTIYILDKDHELLMSGFFFYPEISYKYQKPLLPPFYHIYNLGLNFIPGRSDYLSNGATVYTQFYWGNILFGTGIMASFQKVDFGALINGQLGFLYRSVDYMETIGTVIDKIYFSMGFEISLWGKYYFTDFLSLSLSLNYANSHIFDLGWANGVGANVGMSISF